jgi:hypothetical protein
MKRALILLPVLGLALVASWMLDDDRSRPTRIPEVMEAPAARVSSVRSVSPVPAFQPRRRTAQRPTPPATVAERVDRFVDRFPLPAELQRRMPELSAMQRRLSQRLPPDATRSDRHAQRAEREAFRLALREALSLMDKHQRAAMRRHKLTITQIIRLAG